MLSSFLLTLREGMEVGAYLGYFAVLVLLFQQAGRPASAQVWRRA
jgi:hypothetical protein